VVFARLLLADVASVAAVLASFEVDLANVGRIPGLDALLLCAVRRAEKVLIGRVAKNAVYSALVLVVESQDQSIAALRARRPELRQALLALIVTALTQEVEKEKDRQSAVERQLRKQSADDEDDEDDDEAVFGMLTGGGLELGDADEYRDLLDAFCDGEEEDDDEDDDDEDSDAELAAINAARAAADPLSGMRLMETLCAQLEVWDEQAWFKQEAVDRQRMAAAVQGAKALIGV